MKRRIFGLEHEYGIAYTSQQGHRPDILRYIGRYLASYATISSAATAFLANGARIYLDTGGHPEYATPECDDVFDLVAHDRAGDVILNERRIAAEHELFQTEGNRVNFFLYKNNVDSHGESWGCHENYLVPRTTEWNRLVNALVPFFITRQIFTGSGTLRRHETGKLFCLSQRAEHIWEAQSSTTTNHRPIINIRGETLADNKRFRRLHVIVADSNMSEWATFLKIGTTDMLIRAVESNYPLPDLSVVSVPSAIRGISHDISCTLRIPLRDGRLLSAVEIQREYFECLADFLEREGSDATSEHILKEWGEALEALAAGEFDRLDGKADWVTKYLLIERYREKHGLASSDPVLSLLDLSYHDINPDRGLFFLLQRHGKMVRFVTDAAIRRAVEEPPQTTRARLRGEFIREAQAHQRDYSADWERIGLRGKMSETFRLITLDDPFCAVDERVEHLIAHMKKENMGEPLR